MKKINIGLIGAGTIGSGVIQILKESKDKIANRTGLSLNLQAVCDVNLERLKSLVPPETKLTNQFQEITSSSDIDVIVELVGGTGVALEIARHALKNKKIFVTANKALISEKGVELFQLAKENKVEIGYEAAVGGTIPVIRSLKTGLVTNEFESIYGILNGTTNYILTKMEEEDLDYSTALKQAQKLGFAEKDPTFDVEGIDTAHKTSILAGIAYSKKVPIDKIYIEGISKISKLEIATARELGYRIKLLGVCKSRNDLIEARVHPTMVPISHPIANVRNEVNAIFFHSNYSGPVLLVGKGAGSLPTANAVISDIVFYSARIGKDPSIIESNFDREADLLPIGDSPERFYVRFNTVDKPGVLGEIANTLGKNNISISTVRQLEATQEPVHVIITTHTAIENKLRQAIQEIDKLNIIKEKSVIIRLEHLV